MKKLSFLALAAAGLLFGECSSDDALEEKTFQATGEDIFVGVAIQLPNELTPTRANDDLNNGEEAEFDVKKARLFLFKGATEADATFLESYELTNDFQKDDKGKDEEPATTRVTSTSVSVCKIDALTLLPTEELWAYVVVNPNGSALASNPAPGTTFSVWSKVILDASTTGGTIDGNITGSDGLLMTNAPVSATAGGSAPSTGAVTTAVKLDKNKIKSTETAAKGDPAGCIFVERATAKVTLRKGSLGTSTTLGSKTINFEIDGWQIINTEPKYYNTRQTETAWLPYFNESCSDANTKYRFVSVKQFSPTIPSTGHTTSYRTMFAKDPQYDIDSESRTAGNKLVKPKATDGTGDWLAITGKAYVPENTFDAAHQTRKNTTQATVRVKFNDGNDFYTISNDADYYLSADIETAVTSKINAIYEVNQFRTAATTELGGSVTVSATVDLTGGAGGAHYTVSYTLPTGKSFSNLSTATQGLWNDATTGAKAVAEGAYSVTKYKGGYSYYNIRIQHFGEYETPWSKTGSYITKPGTTTAQIYGSTDADKNFLGRYGIVRDNWYELVVDAIKKLGSPTPVPVAPDPDDPTDPTTPDPTPDDEIDDDYYVSAHVHILPWVLRTQKVEF